MSKGIVRAVKGGSGSGNWGHTGRPGLVGGSGGGGMVMGAGQPGGGNNSKANTFLNGAVTESPYVWGGAGSTDRETTKRTIVSELSQRSGVDEDTINEVIAQWARTSNDNNIRALSLQEAAAEELGLKMSDWQQGKLDTVAGDMEGQYNNYTYRFNIAKHQGDITGDPVSFESFMSTPLSPQELKIFPYQRTFTTITSRANERTIIRAMYDNTQRELAKAGYASGDTVQLYRGISYDSDQGRLDGDIINYNGNAIESWTVSLAVAQEFARNETWGEVVSMAVPVSSIIGTARTGFGCLTEGEFVVAGNVPGSRATVREIGL